MNDVVPLRSVRFGLVLLGAAVLAEGFASLGFALGLRNPIARPSLVAGLCLLVIAGIVLQRGLHAFALHGPLTLRRSRGERSRRS